jgi:HSP20 family protein
MPSELLEVVKPEVEAAKETASAAVRARKTVAPRTDVYESKEQLQFFIDMPGVKQENIDITLEQNILTVRGGVEPPEMPGYRLTYAEQDIADYQRVFTLSNEIERAEIQASIKNGVLKLVLPKSKAALPRKIAIQSA